MILKQKKAELGKGQFNNNTKLVKNCKTIAEILVIS